MARQIRQLKTEKNLSDKNLDAVFAAELERLARANELPTGLTAEDFKKWYRSKMGKNLILQDINSETVAPVVSEHMTWLNRISAAIGKIRDENIVEEISQQLNSNDVVMIVFGGSHFMTQQRALKQMLGAPKITKLH